MDSLKKYELENQTDNSQLSSREPLENTPFTICKDYETSYYGVMGKYRITEQYENKEDLEKELKTIDWNKIVQVITVITKYELQNEK